MPRQKPSAVVSYQLLVVSYCVSLAICSGFFNKSLPTGRRAHTHMRIKLPPPKRGALKPLNLRNYPRKNGLAPVLGNAVSRTAYYTHGPLNAEHEKIGPVARVTHPPSVATICHLKPLRGKRLNLGTAEGYLEQFVVERVKRVSGRTPQRIWIPRRAIFFRGRPASRPQVGYRPRRKHLEQSSEGSKRSVASPDSQRRG